MTETFEVEITPPARGKFPGLQVLARHVYLSDWHRASPPDYLAQRSKWQGWSREQILAHPSVRPFCEFLKGLGLGPSRRLPVFASLIYQAIARDGARPPRVNHIVDHVNMVAVTTLTVLEVFDAAAVQGRLQVDLSRKGELFDALGGDGPEAIQEGRLVLRDAAKIVSVFFVRDSVYQSITTATLEAFVLGCVVPGVEHEQVRRSVELAAECLISLSDGPRGASAPRRGRLPH